MGRLLSRLRERKGVVAGKRKVRRLRRGGVAEKARGGGTWRTFGVGGCLYRTKHGTSNLKKHKASIHAIDIVWHYCPELGCEYKAKKNDMIKQHRAYAHDVGVTLA